MDAEGKRRRGQDDSICVVVSSREDGGPMLPGTVKDALTLRDGPIWWHYQSISGYTRHMHAVATYLIVGARGTVGLAGQRGRVD